MALWDVLPLAASNVGIALISAGAALLGALVGGLVTYNVEQSRQKHERDLEQERHDHERKLELERYEQQQAERKQQDLDVARGLARVMLNDFMLATSMLKVERDQDQWLTEKVWKPRLGADDRRDLFRHLLPFEFTAVVQAESTLERIEGLRHTHAEHEHEGKQPPPSSAYVHRSALEHAQEAREALTRLTVAGQESDSEETG